MRLKMAFSLALLSLAIVSLSACTAMARHHDALAHQVSSRTNDDDQLSGDWNVSFIVQGEKTAATFSLKLEGRKVTGTASSDHTGVGTLRDGVWENGKLSFTLDFKNHESIAITGTLQEGKLEGEFRTEGFVSKWEARKK